MDRAVIGIAATLILILLLPVAGRSGVLCAQDPPDEKKAEETAGKETEGGGEEEEEKKSFLQKMSEALAEDMAASQGLIQLWPGPFRRTGNVPPQSSGGGDYKGGEWFAVPVPQTGPTLGTGLAVGVGYIYRLNPKDEVSQPSLSGIGGMGTSNGTWGLGAAQQMAWKEDRYRASGIGAYANVNYLFRFDPEIGPDRELTIPVNVRGNLPERRFHGAYLRARVCGAPTPGPAGRYTTVRR